MKYRKKQFYKDFYHNHLFRDFLFKKSNPSIKYDTDSPKISYSNDFDSINRSKNKILNFLIKYTNPKLKIHGALYSQVTYYKTINAFKDKDETERFVNNLFFDFDSDNEKLHDLKKEIKSAYDDLTGNDRIKRISEIQNEYQDILLTTDVLKKPFDDAKKLYDFFKSNNINCYTVFSGSKGIHLYLFFNECNLINLSEISYKLAKSYKSALDLETLDLNVNKDAIARKSRVIYSKHETSNLFSTPFDIESESIADVLEKARNQNITPFNINEYNITDNSFVDKLLYFDKIISDKDSELVTAKKESAERLKATNKNYSSRFIPDDAVEIKSIDDVLKLNIFPCFNNLKFSDYNNMLLVNLLFNTNITSAAEIQKAMIIFWNDKGIELKESKSGLKRVKQHEKGKYAPTNNTMKKNNSCFNCSSWKNCFRYKIIFKDEYYERIENYKIGGDP